MPKALAMSAIAAAVDYGATPKRFTPGWEFVLSKRTMTVAYLAMATGLAVGASMNRHAGRDGNAEIWGQGAVTSMIKPPPRACG